jgi:hypothetical protein
VKLHFLHTDEEIDLICRAVLLIAEHGRSGSRTHDDRA